MYLTSDIANGRRRSGRVLFDKQRNSGLFESNVALFDTICIKHVPRKNMANLKLACLTLDFMYVYIYIYIYIKTSRDSKFKDSGRILKTGDLGVCIGRVYTKAGDLYEGACLNNCKFR